MTGSKAADPDDGGNDFLSPLLFQFPYSSHFVPISVVPVLFVLPDTAISVRVRKQ